MDYINGFNDAVSLYEITVENVAKSLERNGYTKETLMNAFNSFVTSLYMLKLEVSRLEDEYLSDMATDYEDEEEEINCGEIACSDCAGEEFCKENGLTPLDEDELEEF